MTWLYVAEVRFTFRAPGLDVADRALRRMIAGCEAELEAAGKVTDVRLDARDVRAHSSNFKQADEERAS